LDKIAGRAFDYFVSYCVLKTSFFGYSPGGFYVIPPYSLTPRVFDEKKTAKTFFFKYVHARISKVMFCRM